jgi:hypothetical protein
LDIHTIGVTDTGLTGIIGGFQEGEVRLRRLDLSNNDFGDMSVDTITPFFETSSVDELVLVSTKMTEFGFQRFFRWFSRENIGKFPRVLAFSFGSQDTNEAALHQFFNQLAQLIASNCPLQELTVKGLVTVVDLTSLLQNIDQNSTLRKLVIEPREQEKQRGETAIDSAIQGTFHEMLANLQRALTDPGSVCVLNTFDYPMINTICAMNEPIMNLWQEIDSILQANRSKE